jgi:hypothetical protein
MEFPAIVLADHHTMVIGETMISIALTMALTTAIAVSVTMAFSLILVFVSAAGPCRFVCEHRA